MRKKPVIVDGEGYCKKRAAEVYKEAYPGEGRRDDKGKAIQPPKKKSPR